MSAVPALNVEGLGHRFGTRQVLKNVTFSVAPGDFTVLLGLNGAGKTTLFSLATRLYAQAEGTIRIFGLNVRERMLECLRQMGIVFQQPTLDLDLSLDQNLVLPLRLARHAAPRGCPTDRSRGRAGRPYRPAPG